MPAIIYRPARNAMQAGKGNSKSWLLVHQRDEAREIEPLMGYTTSRDTRTQVKLSFETQDAAEEYARKNGLAYIVQPPHDNTPKRTVYSDNFRHDRKTPWTH